MTSPVRARPLVLVLFTVPLFVEALTAAFEDLADVRAMRAADAELGGLVAALRPDVMVIEQSAEPELDESVPLVHVSLDERVVYVLRDGAWQQEDIDLSGEAIRNLALSTLSIGAAS